MSEILTLEQEIESGKAKVKANNRYSSKLSYKRMQDLELARQADEYLQSKGIHLPQYDRDFRLNEEFYMTDQETGELLLDEHINIARMIYDFRRHNKGVYDVYTNPSDPKKFRSQIACAWYSRHRCSYVWNWKKSNLIRSIWRKYLIDTHIHEKYQAMHLVLTVPHKDGVWNEKRFYASDILSHFNVMRKSDQWKDAIFGGEYGVEVKKSKAGNGLHIHLHCLVFQKKDIPVNYVRGFIEYDWKALTGAEFVHYETLFVHRKNEQGDYDMVQIPTVEAWHEDPDANILQKNYTDTQIRERKEGRTVKKKYYLDESQEWYAALSPDEKLKQYVNGVMECIKYHFKADWCEQVNGDYDIQLINDVLNQSKGLRFYSKFGGFYGDKALNYDSLTELNLGSDSEYEVDFNSVESIDSNRINPYTNLPAKPGEFARYIAIPEKKIHRPNADLENPNMPLVMNIKMYYRCRPEVTINMIVKSLAKSCYQAILEPIEYERFKNDHMPVSNAGGLTKLLRSVYEQDAIRHFEHASVFGDSRTVPF